MQVDNYAGAPYYKFGVLVDGQNPKLYIDTRTQQLLYDPPVYLGTWHSNHSGGYNSYRHCFGAVYGI